MNVVAEDRASAPAVAALEPSQLAACMGNLVSLLALPSLCQGRSTHDVMGLTLDAVGALLPFELGYIRRAAGIDELRVRRAGGSLSEPERAEVLASLGPLLTVPTVPPGVRMAVPAMGELGLLVIPMGFSSDTGYMVLGARRADFPSTVELIQARGAASLLASTIEGAAARERLEQAHRELEAANRAKDEFLAMLGHELRNPLAPIVTALQLMQLRGGPETKERIIIERQVDHMRRLVDDLLDISRITRGMVELRRTPVELSQVVEKAIEVASPLVESRGHHLVVSGSGSVRVDADPVRAAQVVANLLTNAAKYTEPGGHITVALERDGAMGVVRVTDTGMGISRDMLPRVFDLFSQEGRALDRSQGGLGLGLAIVKSLVSLHGGAVEAHSEGTGRGSQFVVRLPLAADDVEPVALPPPAAAADARDRVLVVDDNLDAAELLAELLALTGYQVEMAHDGDQAVRAAVRWKPRAILLDIGLPVMDGYEVARVVRATPALAGTCLVALTGYGQSKDRERTAAAGFDAHLVKPVSFEHLKRLLAELLGTPTPAAG